MRQDNEFFQGAFLMLAEVYRAHGCHVTVKDCIKIIPNVNGVAKQSAEYDVRSLRQVIKTLPMGCDADYDRFEIKEQDIGYNVYGYEGGESYLLAEFYDYLEAHVIVNEWENQLKEIKSKSAK